MSNPLSSYPGATSNSQQEKRKRVQSEDHDASDEVEVATQPPSKRVRLAPARPASTQQAAAKKNPSLKEQLLVRREQEEKDAQFALLLHEAEKGASRRLRQKVKGSEKPTSLAASPERRPAKKLSVYEEFQKIEREAGGKPRSVRQRSVRAAGLESTTTSSKQTSKPVPLHDPSPSPPHSPDHNTMPPSSTPELSQSQIAHRNTMPPPSLPRLSQSQIARSKQPASKPIKDMLRPTQNGRVTKKNYHTQHERQPHSTQQSEGTAEAQLRIQRETQQARQPYSNHVKRLRSQIYGVQMRDLEYNNVPSIINLTRDSPGPSRNVPGPSRNASGPSRNAPGPNRNALGPSRNASRSDRTSKSVHSHTVAGPSSGIGLRSAPALTQDNIATRPETLERELTPFFDETTSITETLDTSANNPFSNPDFFPLSQQAAILQPHVDVNGHMRAPSPVRYSEEAAHVAWLLNRAQDRDGSGMLPCEKLDWESGWY